VKIFRSCQSESNFAEKLEVIPLPLSEASSMLPNMKTIVNTLDVDWAFPVQQHQVILDASYKRHPLQETAIKNNATYLSGEIWLFHQAVPAFELLSHTKIPSLSYIPIEHHRPNIFFFVGMMKSGKTTIGKAFAEANGWPFIDLDNYIEEKFNVSIAYLFNTYGEENFRMLESKTLHDIVKNISPPLVIATGGGTILQKNNRQLLKAHGYVIWLHASFEELLKRNDNVERPLLKNSNDLAKIYHQRFPLYAEIADEIILTDNKTPQQIIRLLLE